jgi:hypothetical protein
MRQGVLRRSGRLLMTTAATLALVFIAALPASGAGNAGTTSVTRIDPTGAVFICPGTNYTVLGGTLLFLIHDSIAADGSEHLKFTRVPMGVTLSDGTSSTIYRLTGANSSGGNIEVGNGGFGFTDITFFNIIAADGGIVARVAGVEHVGPSGNEFTFTFGECEAPQG